MRRPFHSFYARLSTIFLLLILALGGGFIAIAFGSAWRLFDDVEQLLNREYARSIAAELQPLVAEGVAHEGVAQERIGEAIHYMMVLNPRVEIYLLDGRGRILAYFAGPAQKVVRDRVDLRPIEAFISSGGERGLILGDDPRSGGRGKPFSAAPLRIGEEPGYVYIILGGERYDASLRVIRESYLLRTGLAAFLLALLAALAVGLALFFLLTRRLRGLAEAVQAFRRGELSRRVEVRGQDELADLSRSFNDMAAAIEAGVEKLRQAERLRRELVGNISHDLRSPLTSIQGYLETALLKDAQLAPGERRRFLSISLRNTASLQRLVEALLELARLEAKQVRPKNEPLQIAELVQDVVLKLKPEADRAFVALAADFPPGLPMVCGDVGMIERVLTNLIENALRYTPAGGSVLVALAPEGEAVRVAVADTGVGIGPEDLPRIFDRFYRADKSRGRATGGAGLGLAIARQIVELHGSILEAESRTNEGARFHFRLAGCPGPGR